jgi:hypothetical protein
MHVLPPGNGRVSGHAYRLPLRVIGGSGDGSGMIFGLRAPSGRTTPGFSVDARQTYSFRLRLYDLGLLGMMNLRRKRIKWWLPTSHYDIIVKGCQEGGGRCYECMRGQRTD